MMEEWIRTGEVEALRAALRSDRSRAAERGASGVSALLYAAYCRNAEAVGVIREALDGVDLHEAAAIGEMEGVRKALEADPEAVGSLSADGFSALGLASFFGREEVVLELLARGADARAASQNAMRVTPLHSACAGSHVGIARALLESGADVNARQAGGVAALHAAGHNGTLDLVELLLGYGADPAAMTDAGKTARGLAEEAGHREVAARLEAEEWEQRGDGGQVGDESRQAR